MLGFDFHLFGLPGLVSGKIAGISTQNTAIQLHNPVGYAIQKCPVMGNKQQCASKFREQALKPLNGGEIEVVGRFIQQQQFRVAGQGTRQSNTFLHATRQGFYLRISGQFKASKNFLDAVVQAPGIMHFQLMRNSGELVHGCRIAAFRSVYCRVIGLQQAMRRPRSGNHRFEYRMSRFKLRLLRYQRHAQVRHAPDHTIIGTRFAGDDLHQAGFSRPVAANETNALTFLDDQIGTIQKRPMAKGKRDVVESQIGHAGVLVEWSKQVRIPRRASVAQWIEHPPPKGRVTRSIRVGGAISSFRLRPILRIASRALPVC